jgi:hypothetical protein
MEECDNVAREYFPQNWRGRTRSEQQELFDQMLMYLTQNELHKTYVRKISCDEWATDALNTMRDFYAWDLFVDILIFYSLPDLDCGVEDITYIENKSVLYRTYAMYDDYFELCRYSDCKYYNVFLFIDCFTAY